MKRSLRSRVLSVLMALVMVFSVFPANAFAADSDSVTYTKVTEAPSDWTGEYLLVYEAGSKAFNGSLTSPDAVNNYKDVTIANDSITVSDHSIAVYLEAVTGGYVLKSASGKYLYHSSDANKLSATDNQATAAKYPITPSVTADGVDLKLSGGAHMRFNANADQMRFRYYKSSSYTNQKAVTLYKLEETPAVEDPYKDIDAKYSVYEKVDTIAAGDVVLLYNANTGKVVSSTASSYYKAGVDVTVSDGIIATDADAIEWTVGASNDVYTFTQGEMMLATAASGSYFNLTTNASDATGWTLKQCSAENSSYYVYSSTLTGQYGNVYLEWYASKTAFSAYCTGESRLNENDFGFQFYKLVREGKDEGTGGDSGETPTPDTPTAPAIADGKYVIYNPDSGMAMSSEATGTYYRAGTAVTPVDGVVADPADAIVWDVKNNADGTVTITTSEGKKLSVNASNNSLPLDEVNDTWTIVPGTTEGTYYIVNANRTSNYVQWYAKYTEFTTYSYKASSDANYAVQFLPVKEDNSIIADGKYVIYNPGSGMAMSSEATGTYYRAGTAVTPVDGVVADPADAIVWDVKNNADGTVTITTSEGKKLSVNASNNSLPLDEVNDTWTIVPGTTEGTYYIVNANRTSNYVQWYAKYTEFTTYSYKASSDTNYAVQFLPVETTPDAPAASGKLTSADQFVTGKYAMVVSGGYAMSHLNGTWVEMVQPVIEGDVVTDAKGGVWTLTVSGNTVTITDKNGAAIKPKGGNTNGIASGSYSWNWTFDEATKTFVFSGTGSDTVKLASNASEDPSFGGFHRFRAYKNTTIAGNPSTYPCNFTLYPVVEQEVESNLPAEGDKVVIYNQNAEGVLAAESDTQSINGVPAEIKDGKAIPENGGVVFTVSKNGEYYRFYNETYGYLCSNGTGNNAFYSQTASEDADWLVRDCSGNAGGFELESRVAKFVSAAGNKYSQWLEYYADSYKTYSMDPNKVTDYTIYSFFFYPVASDVKLTGDIVNAPAVVFGTLTDAFVGADYTFSFTVDAAFGVKELTVTVNGETITANEDGTYTVPAEKVTGTELAIVVAGKDNKDVAIEGSAKVTVKDEPSIGAVTPLAGSQTGENKKPVISAQIINAGENAVITMTVNGDAVEAVLADGILAYTPVSDMADGRTSVTVTVVRADGKETAKTWSFTVGKAQYALYFGQLHSHTTYSDGSGSLESALDYIKNLPDSANVDFVAFTDHSNYFDASGAANPESALYDMSQATANSQKLWSEYKDTIAKFNNSQGDVVAIGGFEMTWSGGPGHMNTFNTPGIVSRNNTTLNNKTSDAGMKAYYALLSQTAGAGSVNQFNHPGTTFGTFSDFAYWDAVIDSRIQLVEVGNGEGQVGAGGYFPSYEYYTMALDKGWHVAPTNNQDNHKGKWGNANDARDVVLTDDFSEQGLYQAMRDMRVYSTEDKNLEIGYSVNGMLLGSTIDEVPEKLNVEIVVFDPDSSDSISKVELIVNSGKVAYTWDNPADLADGALSATLDPDYSYYYVRVTQGDGDLAVTAPVWVGEMLKLGISSVECGTSTPVTDEEVTITTTLFNSEAKTATVKSLTYTTDGSKVVGTDTTGYTIPATGTASVNFKYTPTVAKMTKVTVTAVVEQDGKEYTFTMDVTLDVQDASKLVYIGIDASHYNEYVNGNYKDNMGNFSKLAAEYNVRTVQLNTSADLIAACGNEKYQAIILTAPSRRSPEAQAANPLKVYTAEELAAIKAFNANGGTVIVAGWSDHYENYPDVASIVNMKAEEHMAATQNAVLEALGSSLRIGDDATYDDEHNGGQAYRLYFNTYGDSFLTEGVEVDAQHPHDRLYTEVFSHYGGASVYTVGGTLPATVSPVVFGHSGTYSVDVDKDGLGGSSMPKYACAEGDNRLMIMATEQLPGQGLIVVSGAAFMSNFEVQATIEDSGSEKNYSNYKICENLLAMVNPTTITPIAEVQAQTEAGYKYTIEGVVTSNASGYDKDTAFFDCIYVQDATGGVCCFPVAGNFKVGDIVRVTGTTEFYQGEMELQVSAIEKIGEGTVEPKEVTAAQVNDKSVLGQLITVKGTVESFELANGLVQTIMVKDEKGDVVRVFIDGYITTDEDVKNLKKGCKITVTGLASYDDTFNAPEGPFPRIRIRDRADVVCTAAAPQTGDNFHMGLWLSLMALTAAGVVVLFSRKRKEQI